MTIASTDGDQFKLRLPDGMRDRIKAQAARNSRSMNTEIVHLLEAALITESAVVPLLLDLQERLMRMEGAAR